MTSKVSSPYSTGGGGTNFEVKVLSSFLATMICDAPCPCFPENRITSIRLQSKQAGFNTDDVLIRTRDANGEERKLLGQIKHQLSFTKLNEQFREVLESAWNDFSDPNHFNKDEDSIAIITGPLSAQAINDVRRVPELARHCSDAKEFYQKMEAEGFISEGKRSFIATVAELLTEFSKTKINENRVWQFLKSLHLFSYDFDVQYSQDETRFIQLIDISKSQSATQEAKALWAELVVWVSGYNENAGTVAKGDLERVLPSSLSTAILTETGIRSSKSIRKLLEHSELTLEGIKTEVAAGVSLPRTDMVEQSLSALETSQVLLLTSEAGGGKSALAKKILERLKHDGPVFAFRVEIFDFPHLHQALNSIGITDQLSDLSASFGLLPNRVLFIDSVERLLEMSDQQAFTQLLSAVSKDNRWRLVLTCRTHAENWFVTQVLASTSLKPSVVRIPCLTDAEIESVAEQVPSIKEHLTNRLLMDVLRNPFFLSIACRSVPDDLQMDGKYPSEDIKKILWREAVRRPSSAKGGMPERREKEFLSIAVKRAKLMQPYVRIDSNDQEALEALISDSIVNKIDDGRVTPAHDLFEDLAVEEHIDRVFQAFSSNREEFFQKIGSEPALRRAFRHWLIVALYSNNPNVIDFVVDSASDEKVEQFWKDEILVAILLSREAENILQKLKSSLLENKKTLLFRAIHILKTACKEPNYSLIEQLGLKKEIGFSSILLHFMRPSGTGWGAIINFIAENLNQFDLEEAGIIEGLLKEWTTSLDVDAQLNKEMSNAAKIALSYYRNIRTEDKWSRGLEEEFLDIIVRIPQARLEEVRNLYNEVSDADTHSTSLLVEKAVSSLTCCPLCKYVPDAVIETINGLSRPRKRRRARGIDFGDDDFSEGIEGYFGLGRTFGFNTHPPSATQGPFVFLFRFHPTLALEFAIEFINNTAEKYAESNLDGARYTTLLKLEKDKERVLISGERLWCLYRGLTVGPDLLVSCLMAMEAWLLNKAKDGENLSDIAETIYKKTNSVAPISVLVSIATAYPEAFGKSVIPLISSFYFYKVDRRRLARESGHISDVRGLMGIPSMGVEDVYYEERKKADKLEHRNQDLEQLVAKLQFTELRPVVYEIIDKMRSEHQGSEDEEERVVDRLIFKRIDIREWDVMGETPEGVLIGPKVEEPDLKSAVEESEKMTQELNRWARLSNWSSYTFKGDEKSKASFEDWRDALEEAIKLSEQPNDPREENYLNLTNPIAHAASSIVRFHVDELDTKELKWCTEVICEAVKEKAHTSDSMERVQRHASHGSRPSAFVLAILFEKWAEDPKMQKKVKDVLGTALLHSIKEISDYAIAGINCSLWKSHPDFARRCFNILLWKALESEKLFSQRRSGDGNYATKYISCCKKAKKILLDEKKSITLPSIRLVAVNGEDFLQALSSVPIDNIDHYFVNLIATSLNDLAEEFRLKEENRNQNRIANSFEFHHAFYRIYADAMFCCNEDDLPLLLDPLIKSIDSAAKAAGDLMKELISVADRQESHDRFWMIWTPIADKVFDQTSTLWRRADLIKIVLFANAHWKQGIKTWKPIEENRKFITNAFSLVGHTEAGFFALTRLLSNIGSFLLPEAIIDLNDARLRAEVDVLKDQNTRAELEIVLRNTVFLHGSTVRQREKLRVSCIQLLDELVNRGSSLAFQLRELLIAPIANKAA